MWQDDERCFDILDVGDAAGCNWVNLRRNG